jgi:amino acid adenylation domain-containing protein
MNPADPRISVLKSPENEALAREAVGTEEDSESRHADDDREVSVTQQSMLAGEEIFGGTAMHLLFSAEIRGKLDEARLRTAINVVTQRHESLRTVFRREDGDFRQRVLASWQPRFISLGTVSTSDVDPVQWTHGLLASSSSVLLRPLEEPPVLFSLAQVSAEHHVFSLLIHHAVSDGWSIGILWRDLAECYAEGGGGKELDGKPSLSTRLLIAMDEAAMADNTLRDRVADLADVPTTIEIPSDLTRPERASRAGTRLIFDLTENARLSCAELSKRVRVTRNVVVASAWSLALGRRSGQQEFILGVASAGRSTPESMQVIGSASKVVPVRCVISDETSVQDYLLAMNHRLRKVMASAPLPHEYIIRELGAAGNQIRNPLIQVVFAAHDELIPARIVAGDLTFSLHEGHCGGAAFDAALYIQRWDAKTRLALEYCPEVLTPQEAANLAEAVSYALEEMASGLHRPLAEIRTIPPRKRELLAQWGTGPHARVETGIWQVVEEAARRHPASVAVRDGGSSRELTYEELLRAVAAQAVALASAGVGVGDRVAFAGAISAAEVVGLLAILRLGAAYVAIDQGAPPPVVGETLRLAEPRVVLGDATRIRELGSVLGGYTSMELADPWAGLGQEAPVPPAAAAADPSRVAYIAFASGTTGTPKGAQIPHRGVVRLVKDAGYLRPGACDRFLRLAPLAFGASSLEIFAPLATGGTIEVYPHGDVSPAGLAAFAKDRQLTGMWLTAELFRVVADHRPDAFDSVLQLLVGGDVVSPSHVRRVLERCPRLQVTNSYGPTENTTFTTVHHIDDPVQAQGPLPIGKPVPGTGVVVLDRSGRLVPPGSIGELYTYGEGLALGYLKLPEQTKTSFGRLSPEIEVPLYRTGDFVRWDGYGRLAFLGRRDRQVKIRGFRIETEAVSNVIRQHPDVRDALVIPVQSETADRRLLAGIVAASRPGLIADIRRFISDKLPSYAVPSLWVVADSLPMTENGEVDFAKLERLALGRDEDPPQASSAPKPEMPPGASDPIPLETAIASICSEVLGVAQLDPNVSLFKSGADSLHILRIHAKLVSMMPGSGLAMADFFRNPTIRSLASYIQSKGGPAHLTTSENPS